MDEPLPSAEERKIVSVVFVDLVGFTSRAELLDPEDVGGLQTPYYARVRKEIQNYGGTVEKFIGDAVVAVFGAPLAHEDDPARAMLAALAVRDAIADMNADDPSLELHIRVAVTTGEALVRLDARPEQGEGIAAGDVAQHSIAPAVGRAGGRDPRRRRHAPARASISSSIRAAEPGSVAKGKAEPVRAWEAVDSHRAPRRRHRVPRRRRARRERRRARNAPRCACARGTRARAPQLVTLVGVPGIGKSRLVWELYEALHTDPSVLVAWRQGRSLPYGEGVAYWALGEVTKSHAGVLESDDAQAAEAKLRAAVDGVIPDKVQARWVEGHLRPLAGLEAGKRAGRRRPERGVRRLEAILRGDRRVESARPRLRGSPLGRRRSARLRRLHGGLDERRSARAGLYGSTRASRSPPRVGRRQAQRDDDLARAALRCGDRSAPVVTFGERGPRRGGPHRASDSRREAIHSMRRSTCGCSRQATAGCRFPRRSRGSSPRGSTRSRPTRSALIQAAATVGKVFWVGAVAQAALDLDRTEIERGLHALERKEFVRRERRSSVAGESAYVFRHVARAGRRVRTNSARSPGGLAPARGRMGGVARRGPSRGSRRHGRAPLLERPSAGTGIEAPRGRPCRACPPRASRRGRPRGRLERFRRRRPLLRRCTRALAGRRRRLRAAPVSVRPRPLLLSGRGRGEPHARRRGAPRLWAIARAHRRPRPSSASFGGSRETGRKPSDTSRGRRSCSPMSPIRGRRRTCSPIWPASA